MDFQPLNTTDTAVSLEEKIIHSASQGADKGWVVGNFLAQASAVGLATYSIWTHAPLLTNHSLAILAGGCLFLPAVKKTTVISLDTIGAMGGIVGTACGGGIGALAGMIKHIS